jgi:hypothetical protein
MRMGIERKQKILHVILRSLKQSLLTYAQEHGMFTVPSLQAEEDDMHMQESAAAQPSTKIEG